ncbi:MAG: glycosyltransferase family 39 protein [Bryobacterales bacterium]|nr:glycosyltransferase family 39 protein [Bryobacterales bacterium]
MRLAQAVLVWVLALVVFGYGAGRADLGSGYIDPEGRIAPQDEAVYTHIALGMVQSGDWLTPRFLGRLALFKPPLLYWGSAASLRLLGGTAFAARLPSLLAAATIALVLFLAVGGWRGAVAAGLWVANPLAYTLARVNLTDSLLACWILLASVAIWRRWRAVFAVAVAAAILTKAIAGLMPVVAIGIWWLLTPGKREQASLWLPALLAACVLTVPWFLYQFLVHPRWFQAEFIDFEILGFTLGAAPPQTTGESSFAFYALRLAKTSAPLLLITLAALPNAWRSRKQAPLLVLAVSVAAVTLAVAGNSYRNFAYVLPAIPLLCWLAGRYAPRQAFLAALLLPFFLQPAGPPIAVADGLKRYQALDRGRELILVDTDDQFLAATMGFPKLRYAFFGKESDYRRFGLDFRHLGIVMTPEELAQDPAPYIARLREWDNGPEPIGTVLVLESADKLTRLLAQRKAADFVIPAKFRAAAGSTHEVREDGRGYLFLLAR